ncbi:MAG: hypothetical protein ACOYMA_19600 [Bacteroidia bacterium]
MTKFIKISNTYDPLTTQGEGEKLINVNHIIHISKWTKNMTNKRISTIKTRIKLSDGEILEVKETVEDIIKMINCC